MQPVMQFSHGGKSYRIAFKHETFQRPPKSTDNNAHEDFEYPMGTIGHQRIKGRTTCFIRAWEQDGDPGTSALIGQGVAECALTDSYKKEAGRQVALKRAISDAWPVANPLWELAHDAYANRNRAKTKKPAEPEA